MGECRSGSAVLFVITGVSRSHSERRIAPGSDGAYESIVKVGLAGGFVDKGPPRLVRLGAEASRTYRPHEPGDSRLDAPLGC